MLRTCCTGWKRSRTSIGRQLGQRHPRSGATRNPYSIFGCIGIPRYARNDVHLSARVAPSAVEEHDQERLREDGAEGVEDYVTNRWSAKTHEALVELIERSHQHATGNRESKGAGRPALPRPKRRSRAERRHPGAKQQQREHAVDAEVPNLAQHVIQELKLRAVEVQERENAR